MCGSPPCQEFSSASGGAKDGAKAHLTIVYARIVALLRPEVFVYENVIPALKRRPFQIAIQALSNIYHVCYYRVCAFRHHAPQRRRRLFVVGFRREADAERFRQWCARPDNAWPLAVADALPHVDRTIPLQRLGFEYNKGVPNVQTTDTVFPTVRRNTFCCAGAPVDPRDVLTIAGFPRWFVPGTNRRTLGSVVGNCVCPNVMRDVVRAAHQCVQQRRDADDELWSAIKSSGGYVFGSSWTACSGVWAAAGAVWSRRASGVRSSPLNRGPGVSRCLFFLRIGFGAKFT